MDGCKYVYTYVHAHIYIYISMYLIYIYISIIYISYTYIYIYMCVCVFHLYIYIYMYTCVHVRMCVYIYIYIYVFIQASACERGRILYADSDRWRDRCSASQPLRLGSLWDELTARSIPKTKRATGRTYKGLVVVRHSWSPHADGRLPERWLFRVPVLISQNFPGFEFRHSLSSVAGQSQKVVQLRSRCPSSARESCCLHAGPCPFFHRFCEDCGQQHLLHSMECVYELPGVSLAKLR